MYKQQCERSPWTYRVTAQIHGMAPWWTIHYFWAKTKCPRRKCQTSRVYWNVYRSHPFFQKVKDRGLRTVTIRDNWLIKYQISEHRSSQPAVKVNWKGGQPCLTPLQGSLQRFRCTQEEVLCEERRNIYSSFNIDADLMNPCTLCTHKTQVSHHHL